MPELDPTRAAAGGDPPVVSILLPAHDAGATLPAALHSVRRQTLSSWECVVVDDGSADDTARLVQSFADRDGRFRLVRRPRGGLVPALNAGLDLCRGSFVARMDADDLMHRRRIEDQTALLTASTDLAGVGCHVRVFPRDGLGPGNRAYESWLNSIDTAKAVEQEAFVECPVAHPTLLVRRDALSEARYRDMGWPEDYDLILRLLTTGKRIGVLPRRRLSWRHGPDRLSRSSNIYGADRFTACKAAFLASSFLARTERYVLWGYGGTGRALRAALEPLGKRPSHIVELHPGRLGNSIHGAPVVSPSALFDLPRLPVVASVAGLPARTQIRGFLRYLGLREPQDFICAA